MVIVSAGNRDAGDHADLAVHEVAAPTGAALPAIPAGPADNNPITHAPIPNTRAQCIDVPGDLVAGGHRKLHTGPLAIDKQRVGVTDAAGLHGDAHAAGPGFDHCAIDQSQFSSR